MSDLEFLDKYVESNLVFIDPRDWREIRNRGLVWVVNDLHTQDVKEAKSIVRAKLSTAGKYSDDPHIQLIASKIDRMKFLRKELIKTNVADPTHYMHLLDKMTELAEDIRTFYEFPIT